MGAPFSDNRDPAPGLDSAEQTKEILALRRDLALAHARLRKFEHDLAATRPLIKAVRDLKVWDYTPYTVNPGPDWVAVDRAAAEELLATLARIDHWVPWRTRLEPRSPL